MTCQSFLHRETQRINYHSLLFYRPWVFWVTAWRSYLILFFSFHSFPIHYWFLVFFFLLSFCLYNQAAEGLGGGGRRPDIWFQVDFKSRRFFFFLKEKEFPLLFFLPPHSFICIYSFLDPLLFSHLCLFRRSRRPPHLISLSWFIFILYFLFPPFFFLDYS